MIKAVTKLVLPQDKLDEALIILRSFANRTRGEAGCLDCSLYQDTENDHVILYEEAWRNEAALHHHLAREDYQKVLLVIEMASIPPKINFETIESTAGMEFIERARTACGGTR